MAGGYSERKQPPYYGGYQYPYPHIRFETPTAVKILFFGLIIMIIVQSLGLLTNLVVYSFSNSQSFDDFRSGFFIMGILSSISGILFWVFIILLVISVFVFHRGKLDFNQQHHDNIKWGIRFLVAYVILFALAFIITIYLIASMIFSEQYYGIPPYYTGVSSVITILQSFFMGFLILFLVKEIISPRERDLLYIFAGLMVLIPLIQAITGMIENFSVASDDSTYTSDIFYTRLVFFGLCNLVIWIIAAVAFFNISRRLKVHGRTVPDKPGKFLPRPKAISKYLYQFYTKPKISIIAIGIAAIIVGAGVGVSAQALQDRIFEPSINFGDDMVSGPSEYHIGEDGMLTEGNSIEVDIPIDADLLEFEAFLYWTDEPDQGRRNNEPDVFTLQVDLNGESGSDTNQNPHGGEGQIGLSWNYDENESYYVDRALIIITLETAGDQEGPIGLPFSPYTIADNSNVYYLEVYYTYIHDFE
jgi:hypothetical protein